MTFSSADYDNLIIVRKKDSIIIVTGIQRYYPVKNLIEEYEYCSGKQYKLLASGSIRRIKGDKGFTTIIRPEEGVEVSDEEKKELAEFLEDKYYLPISFDWR